MRTDVPVVPLSKAVTFRGGGTPSKRNTIYWGGPIPWVSPKDMKSDLVGSSQDTITSAAITESSVKIIPEGATLIVVRSGILARTVPVALAACELTVNQDLKALIPGMQIESRYLNYFLRSAETYLLSRVTRGATVHKLDSDVLKTLPIPLPTKEEQKRIVAILDEAFAGIATAVANNEKNLDNARGLFKSYLNSLFLRNEHVWTRRKLEEVCKKITVGHVGSMAKRYKPDGIPLLRSQNIRPFRVDLEKVVYIDQDFHAELKKSALRPGDLGIVRTGYPGTAAVIPHSLPVANCSDLVIVRPGDQVLSDFLAVVFNSTFGKQTVAGVLVGAAQKHFNVTAAKAALVPIPSIKEQGLIVAESNEVREECEKIGAIYRQKLTALAELKQSLLQKAFSGEQTAGKVAPSATLKEEEVA